MYYDTHCHLNFEAFDGKVEDVINEALSVGVRQIVIPGTDIPTSEKAIKIAEKYEGVYAAVGIHPHHIFQYQISKIKDQNDKSKIKNAENDVIPAKAGIQSNLIKIEKLLSHPKVVAVGEIGIDRHYYLKTKHQAYEVNEEFIDLQKQFFLEQIKLAHKYKKSLIFHNREAKKDVLDVLTNYGLQITNYRSVFHCCEPDPELLEFAKKHKMFIGVDGDITYYKEKQQFLKKVPLEMLVLETDSPFLNPEPLRSNEGSVKNSPKNITVIAEFVAKLKGIAVEDVEKQTTENAKRLFNIS